MIASISRVAVPLQRPAGGRQMPRRARAVAPRAMLPDMVATIADAAAAAPGSVDAPIGAIVLGAIVVTGLSFAVSAGLKPGTDAAIEIQKRDAKKYNKYDD
ncbi:hypothetical protein ACK3TF_004979 [Chlorella vulgaris]